MVVDVKFSNFFWKNVISTSKLLDHVLHDTYLRNKKTKSVHQKNKNKNSVC